MKTSLSLGHGCARPVLSVTSAMRRATSSETRSPVVDRGEQHRVVAAAEPAGSVGRGEQRLDLSAVR